MKAKKVRSVRAPFKRDDEWIFAREDQRIAPRGDAPEDPGRCVPPDEHHGESQPAAGGASRG